MPNPILTPEEATDVVALYPGSSRTPLINVLSPNHGRRSGSKGGPTVRIPLAPPANPPHARISLAGRFRPELRNENKADASSCTHDVALVDKRDAGTANYSTRPVLLIAVAGTRKVMIVALARKLLIALWRFVATGETLEGVILRPAG